MNILPLRKLNVLLRFNFPSTQFEVYFENNRADLVALMLKNLPAMQETKVPLLGQEDPLVKGMATHSSILFFFFFNSFFFFIFIFIFFTPVFLPGEFHGQRSLAGYSPSGCKESDMTELLTI